MNANAKLTKREAEFTELVAWGATKKDIANRCFVSVRTVENTFRSVFRKTGVTKVNELSAWWFCVRFNIPFDMSPLKKQALAISFLLLIGVTEYQSFSPVRVFRARRTEVRANRTRRNRELDFDYLLEI